MIWTTPTVLWTARLIRQFFCDIRKSDVIRMMLIFLTAVILSFAFSLAGWIISGRAEENRKLPVYLTFTAAALLAAVATRWMQTYHAAHMIEAAVLKSCASLSPVLLSTVVLSLRLSEITFFAAAVFACSDLMLIANIATGGTVLTRLIALLVYYASLILYATVIWKSAEADI